ncbi:CotY/CotZ family spore coat protein [Bacillus testis]|uniref:CotY/CotZ family spore coat protein n=1 Tax=Bacillus testis TaxID=1622072 RepID=UPI00067EC35E|nr:CotY/CotZ family spore coat protein [Bacillus testis]
MSCGHDKFTNDCVCSTLLSVAEAQEKVEDECRTGCQQAIDELNGRVKIRGFDTIPVLITCNCQPFSGVGALRSGYGEKMFNVIRSFLFRVNEVDENTCCATLELLKPVVGYHDDYEREDSADHEYEDQYYPTAFDEFLAALNDSKKIVRTGICITLDLKAATSVTCLPPIHTV